MIDYRNHKYQNGEFNWNLIDLFAEMVATAPKEIRRDIEKAVRVQIRRQESEGKNTDLIPYCEYERAVEMGESWWGWGPFNLYVWFDKNQKPFYVGQSENATRISEFKYKTRSKEFQHKVREGGCHAYLVARHIPGNMIDRLEKALIAYLTWKKCSLVNKRDVPTRLELATISLFEVAEGRVKIRETLGEDFEQEYVEHCHVWGKMRPVFDLVETLMEEKWEGGVAELPQKNKPA